MARFKLFGNRNDAVGSEVHREADETGNLELIDNDGPNAPPAGVIESIGTKYTMLQGASPQAGGTATATAKDDSNEDTSKYEESAGGSESNEEPPEASTMLAPGDPDDFVFQKIDWVREADLADLDDPGGISADDDWEAPDLS